jgi:hypothetical protein
MSAGYVVTPHDVSPESALWAIRGHGGPILLDFDETLYLRNSTEDFIDCARPSLLALLLMRVLDGVQPWRWTGGEATRDVWRVRAITTVFPWTGRRWRVRAVELAHDFTNKRLMAALGASRATPIITTVGFRSIVTPLVAALGLPDARIVAARLSTCADRRAGKLTLTVEALGADTVRRALVLTDSEQDLGLLDACAHPLRTVWPEAGPHAALSRVYLPGQYLAHVKRPGARYILRGILQEDFALWVLSSVALASAPALHVFGLLFLLASFWAVYERGYVDNDLIAARFEDLPKLSAAFSGSTVATSRWQPWAWALGCGATGVVLLLGFTRPAVTGFVAWAAVLLATHGWFLLYNRLDKGSRIWLFAGLQLARSAAFVAIVPVGLIGAIGIGAHVLARWAPYYLYRLGGKEWPDAPFHLIRLLFFIVLAVLVALATGWAVMTSATAIAILLWNVYRARQELRTAVTAARRLDRSAHGPTP